MTQRDDLHRLIAGFHLREPVRDDTSLVRSGLLDSAALFNLVLWVEEQTGRPLDPTRLDVREDFETVDRILALVARTAAAPTMPR